MSVIAAGERSRIEVASKVSAELNLIDEEHPWLGLDSFSEETRQYFHGREEEIGELSRRVQRKTLSILFGQSGLGKTSILRAGIVPRLRREGFCPVYVRIDYARESPAPSQQIKQAIFRATEGMGRWTKSGAAIPGESLWEFLHHRDDFLVDAEGRALTPLLIFDQFEEIFTLAQDDDFGRKRVAEFVEDLADLVENRAPKSLEVMLETEDSVSERFDFNRADYRILIALREDYLPHLEGLKGGMPSITQNRMRLARMTGHQALVAVVKPGGRLVTEEVAESIVRFVSGGAELRNAEVEPSLLSLVCRELNNARISQHRDEISADLLAGSRETILHEFYERSLEDQPPGVRRFIEDEMLTESGFRESVAEERVIRAFDQARAEPGALSALVNRRLLRIEERLDLRRVELTHDVLCAVVALSRERRHEREARDEAERELAAQKTREASTRRALVRARQVAAGCAVLSVVAIGGAFFGYVNMKRAQEAETNAQQTRLQAESARTEAEKLVVYLLDDFYLELEPVGRLDIVADLSRRALAYYDALPPALRTDESERNRALALVRYGYVLRYQAKLDEGAKVLDEALAILARLQSGGDRSEATAIGLALGRTARARVHNSQAQDPEAFKLAMAAPLALAPLMAQATPSERARRAQGAVMNYLGFAQLRGSKEADAVKSLESAREAYRGINGLVLDEHASAGSLAAAAGYAEASSWQIEALQALGRMEDAKRIGEEAAKVAARVLESRPGHMPALRAHALLVSSLASIESDSFRYRAGIALAREAERDWVSYTKLDKANVIAWNNLSSTRSGIAGALEQMGRVREGLADYRASLKTAPLASPGLASNFVFVAGRMARLEAELGIRPEGVPEYRRFADISIKSLPPGAYHREFLTGLSEHFDRQVLAGLGRHAELREAARSALPRIEGGRAANENEARNRFRGLTAVHFDLGWSAYHLGDFQAAAAELGKAVEYRQKLPLVSNSDRYDLGDYRVAHALALAKLGNSAEASKLAQPEIKHFREVLARGSEDMNQRVTLARALLAYAIAQPEQSAALLAEASALLDKLPAEMVRMRSVSQVRAWVSEERAKRS
jgi:hypothetical protein